MLPFSWFCSPVTKRRPTIHSNVGGVTFSSAGHVPLSHHSGTACDTRITQRLLILNLKHEHTRTAMFICFSLNIH